MTLKSRSELLREQSKAMDFMDADQVLEVPDTPDRLAAAAAAAAAAADTSDCSIIEMKSDASMNYRVMSKDYINGRMRNQPKEKGKSVPMNGNRRLFIQPDSSRPLKNARPTVDTSRHDKGKSLCNSDVQKSTCQRGGNFVGQIEQNGYGRSGISRANACRKGVLLPNALDGSSKSCKLNDTLKTGSSSDHGKGVEILAAAHHKADSDASACMQPCTSSKVPRQKMLVRNGCISPHNIAKSKNVAEKHETGGMKKEAGSDSGTLASDLRSSMVDIKDIIAEAKDTRRCKGKGVSDGWSSMVDIKDLISEAKDSRRCKGKGVSCLPSSGEPDAGDCHSSHRRPIHKQLADSSSDFRVDASRCSAESEKWRTTYNQRKQRDVEQQKRGMMQRDHTNEINIQHLDESEIVSSPRMSDPPQTMSPHAHRSGINRQRESTASRNFGKRSMPCVDVSGGEPSTSRSKRNKTLCGGGTSIPVSDPNACPGNDEDSSARALQVDADEMFARELQRQLFDEELAPAVGVVEMDSHLAFAMAMEQDNSSWHAEGHHAHRRRVPSMLNVRERTRLSTSRRPSIRRRLLPQARTSTRTPQLRSRFLTRPRTISSTSNPRNSIFPPNMDVDMRMQILETLEAVGDMRMPNDLLQVGREFNEGDYEMLLALDEDNHHHGGATRAQINYLPETTVQTENFQECTICLEAPTVGEIIRHLPCLHTFHKACIDQWLRRKTSCPVCKSSVT